MEFSSTGVAGFRLKSKNNVLQIERGVVEIGADKPFKITAPGEYEVGGVSVIGLPMPDGKIFVIEFDGLRVAYLQDVKSKLTDQQLEDLGSIDVLLLHEQISELTSQVDPWVLVTDQPHEGITPTPKYAITADKLPTEFTTIVLERKD